MRPTAADRERISVALRACLGDAALPLEAGLSTSLFSRSVWAKVCAVGAAIGVVGGSAFLALREPVSLQSVALNPGKSVAATLTPTEPSPLVRARSAPQVTVEPKASPESVAAPGPSASPARRPSDRLAQEVAILSRATSELHAGRAASALRAIEEHQRKFPNGLLAQERRAARVQALCALGRRSEAEPELERLAQQAPQAPNTLRAKQICGAPARSR